MDHHDILNSVESICTFRVVGAAICNVSHFHSYEFDKWKGHWENRLQVFNLSTPIFGLRLYIYSASETIKPGIFIYYVDVCSLLYNLLYQFSCGHSLYIETEYSKKYTTHTQGAKRRQDSSVSIGGLDDWTIMVQFLKKVRFFFHSLGSPPASYSMGTRDFFPVVNQMGCKIYHSSSSSAKVKNAWSPTPIPLYDFKCGAYWRKGTSLHFSLPVPKGIQHIQCQHMKMSTSKWFCLIPQAKWWRKVVDNVIKSVEVQNSCLLLKFNDMDLRLQLTIVCVPKN